MSGDATAGVVPGDAMTVIDDYLDLVAARVGVADRDARRLLSETGDHLVESTLRGIHDGATPSEAAVAAIRSFGDPADIAAADRAGLLPSPGLVVRQLVDLVLRVGIVGGLALGLSGLLAWLAGTVISMSFVAGDGAGVAYSPERCAQYIALFREPLTCLQAALLDHFGEVVDGRIVLGVMTLVIAAGWLVWRRRPGYRAAPRALVGVVGVALAGLALVGLALWSVNLAAVGVRQSSMNGVGAPLSAAVAAALAMLVFMPSLVAAIRAGQLLGAPRRPLAT